MANQMDYRPIGTTRRSSTFGAPVRKAPAVIAAIADGRTDTGLQALLDLQVNFAMSGDRDAPRGPAGDLCEDSDPEVVQAWRTKDLSWG